MPDVPRRRGFVCADAAARAGLRSASPAGADRQLSGAFYSAHRCIPAYTGHRLLLSASGAARDSRTWLGETTPMPNCFANLHNELIQEINDRVADESVRERLLRRVLPGLYLPSGIAQTVLENLKELLRGAGTIDSDSLEILAEGISCFGDSVALSSVLTLDALPVANRPVGIHMPKPPYLLTDALGEASVRLGIAYSPDVSVAEYVRVLEPHVGSCATLFTDAGKEDQYERVIQRTRDISSEIRFAARSKRGRIANFGLTLGRANPAVVAGLLGGGLGLAAAGLAGCGLGSAAAAPTGRGEARAGYVAQAGEVGDHYLVLRHN